MESGSAASLAQSARRYSSYPALPQTKRRRKSNFIKQRILWPIQSCFRTPVHERILRRKPPPLKPKHDPVIKAVPAPPPFRHQNMSTGPRPRNSVRYEDNAADGDPAARDRKESRPDSVYLEKRWTMIRPGPRSSDYQEEESSSRASSSRYYRDSLVRQDHTRTPSGSASHRKTSAQDDPNRARRVDSGMGRERASEVSTHYEDAQSQQQSPIDARQDEDDDIDSDDSELRYYRSKLADKRLTLLRGSTASGSDRIGWI